ncbi:unnamed protein product [Symbiodinium sp. CCMP2592]|nr:unnamed protein product [Symbiodinium sp. CCMP2592]
MEGFEAFSSGHAADGDEDVAPPPAPHPVPRTPTKKRPAPGTPTSSACKCAPRETSSPATTEGPMSEQKIRLCIACTRPATKGSLCDDHKRVSDNLYTAEKKLKDQEPDRWKRFMNIRKQQGPEWQRMLVEAEPAKGGNPGSGRKTGNYQAIQEVTVLSQQSSMTANFQNKSMNRRMYITKITSEWGWDPKDASEEWKRVLAATPDACIEQKPTAPGRQLEPWIYIHDFDTLLGSQGLAHQHQVQLKEKEKKNPKEADIEAAEEALTSSSLHFSDNFFSRMGSTKQALRGVQNSGGSAIVDSSGRSVVFAEPSSFRSKAATPSKGPEKEEKKKKAKPFVLEDMLDGLDFRLKKRCDSAKKSAEDLLKEIQEFWDKETPANMAKMTRVSQQVSFRVVVIKAVAMECDDLPKDLTLTPTNTGGLSEAECALVQPLVKGDHGLQYGAALKLVAVCTEALALFEKKTDDAANHALHFVTAEVGDIFERGFSVPQEDESDDALPMVEKELLQNIFSLHGWAGSGFSVTPDFEAFLQDVHDFAKVTFAKIFMDLVIEWFSSGARFILEPALMEKVAPLLLINFRYHVLFRLQDTEDGVKKAEQQLKDELDLNRSLVTGARSSFSQLTRQSRDLRKESARLQAQQDKERAAAEKQREREEKSKVRGISDQMRGGEKLPGLLAFCGSWIKPMPEYKTIAEYRAGKPDFKKRFIISDVETLKAEESKSSAKVNFSLFKASFPKSNGAQQEGYSHCAAPATDDVREKLMELAPSTSVKLTKCCEIQGVSMWGCTADMIRTSYELLGLGALKFASRGTRELTCISFDNVTNIIEKICSKLDETMRMMSTFLHDRLDKNGLVHIEELPDLEAFRITCPPGSMCYIPSGYIFSERTLNGQMTYGWRCTVVESCNVAKLMQKFIDDGCLGKQSMQVLEKAVKEIAKPAQSNGGNAAVIDNGGDAATPAANGDQDPAAEAAQAEAAIDPAAAEAAKAKDAEAASAKAAEKARAEALDQLSTDKDLQALSKAAASFAQPSDAAPKQGKPPSPPSKSDQAKAKRAAEAASEKPSKKPKK